MGLDITAYRGLRRAQPGEGMNPKYGDADYENGWHEMYVNSDFPSQADDIVDRAIYHADDDFGFRAGSYSGYSVWRDQLAEMVGYPAITDGLDKYRREYPYSSGVHADPKPGPFVELINFSDCEGVIGPKTSAKLAADFKAFQEKADAHPDDWFREKYADWRKAFEMAADNGAVSFH
jgi:hypothetical protein